MKNVIMTVLKNRYDICKIYITYKKVISHFNQTYTNDNQLYYKYLFIKVYHKFNLI